MKTPKLEIKKAKEKFKKLLRILGEKAFLTLLGLIALSLIFGGFLFYKYSILAKEIEPQITEKPLQFKEKTYDGILEIWQEREERFKETDFKQYPNPFR